MDLSSVRWELGPFSLTSSSLSFSVAFLTALLVTYLESRHKLLSRQQTLDFMLFALISGLAGGRLVYALCMDRIFYLENPARLFYFRSGGFSFFGGLLTALIVLSIWAAVKKLILERFLDCAAPGLALALLIGWIGGYSPLGRPMVNIYPWSVRSGAEVLHPDGVYAIVLLTIILNIIWRRRFYARYDGELFLWFVGCYALTIVLVERFRVVDPLWRGFSLEQLAAAAALLLSLFYILFASKNYISPYRYYGRPSKRLSRSRRLFGFVIALAVMAGLIAVYYYLHR